METKHWTNRPAASLAIALAAGLVIAKIMYMVIILIYASID